MRAVFGLLLLFPLLNGCYMLRSYQDVPIKNEVSVLQKGLTQPEVLKFFGPPTQLLQTPNGLVFIYLNKGKHYNELYLGAPSGIGRSRFTLFSLFWEHIKEDKLLVLFDVSGKVSDYAYHQGTDELKTFF